MKRFASLIFGALCLLAHQVSAEVPTQQAGTKEEMANHLIGIQNLFQTMYAPAEWKREYTGWDLKEAVQEAIEKVSRHPNITLKDYQEILVELFSSAMDYHVGVYFYSTEFAQLPFRIRGAEGRYFVAWVSPYVPDDFPLQKGDEVLAFGGKPIQEAVDSLITLDRRDWIKDTDTELAATFLTLRSGVLGHRVPQGDIDILVNTAGDKSNHTYTLTWDYQPELIRDLQDKATVKQKTVKRGIPRNIYEAIERFGTYSNMSAPIATAIAGTPAAKADGAFPIGDHSGALPPLGEVLWESGNDKHFRAYIFKSDKGKAIGYIRIPHFLGTSSEDDQQSDVAELQSLVRQFQRRTEKLVIDLTDNNGGYWHLMLDYLGIFTDKPLPLFKQRICLTQDDVHNSLMIMAQIDQILKEPVQPEEQAFLLQIRDYFSFIYNEWNEGRSFSNPVHLYGVEHIIPDPVTTYKKPILVLVNALDLSCADIFPAILQDSGRATIFGSTTAGAGGSVRTYDYPNRMGIVEYTYTATFIERLNKQPLENLGVTPDVLYKVTAEDLQNDYQGYIKAVNKALMSL